MVKEVQSHVAVAQKQINKVKQSALSEATAMAKMRDGVFELVVNIRGYDLKFLKKIKGVSDNIIVANTSSSGSYFGSGLSSYIVPDGVLIKEMEIEGTASSATNKLPVVDSPLKK